MTLTALLRTELRPSLLEVTAADLMAPNPISLRAEASVAEAMRLFTDKGISAAPVIDDSGRPIGVVSRTDLLIHECEKEKLRNGVYFRETPIEGAADAPKPVTPMNVQELMTPAVFSVSEDTPLHRVVSDMIGLRVHRLFVVAEDGTLVGIITTMDVLKHLLPDEYCNH